MTEKVEYKPFIYSDRSLIRLFTAIKESVTKKIKVQYLDKLQQQLEID